jgi:hypothetical protein
LAGKLVVATAQKGAGTGLGEVMLTSTNIGWNRIMSVVTAGMLRTVLVVVVLALTMIVFMTLTTAGDRHSHDVISEAVVVVVPPSMEIIGIVTEGQDITFMPPRGLGGGVYVTGHLPFSVPPSSDHKLLSG